VPRSFSDAFDLSRSLATGFEALKAAPWPLLLGALLMQCTESSGGNSGGGGGGGGGGGDSWGEYDSWDSYDWQGLGARAGDFGSSLTDFGGRMGAAEAGLLVGIILAVVGLGLCCGLAVLAFRAWLHGGYLRLHEEVLRTGQGGFGTLFGGADVFLSMVGFKVVSGLIKAGIFLLTLTPGLVLAGVGVYLDNAVLMVVGGLVGLLLTVPIAWYVGLGLYFGNHAVALDNAGVMGALERSWDLARGNRLWLTLYLLVTWVVWVVGMCLCCVGIIVTRAIVDVARTEAYLLATRDSASSDELWTLGA